jgi:diadenosine tetraphosphate (Ap4A) HIT family hydrolase
VDSCLFCAIECGRPWIETEHAMALPNAAPVTDGHTLVVPRKHVANVYELGPAEQQAVWELVSEVRKRLLIGLAPAGLSIGFSDVAGHHVHVHVVPRRAGEDLTLPADIEWVTDDLAPAEKR